MLSCSVWKCVKTCSNTRYLFILQLYSFNIKAKWCNFRKWLCRQVLSSCVPVRSDTPNLFHDDVKEISRERQPWVWVATPHETLYKPLTPVCSTVIQSVVDMCAPSRYFYQSWIYKPKTLTESQRQWWVIVGHTDCWSGSNSAFWFYTSVSPKVSSKWSNFTWSLCSYWSTVILCHDGHFGTFSHRTG